MNRKILGIMVTAILLSASIPMIIASALSPKPKILIRMDVPLASAPGGTSELHGDNVIFKDLCWVEGGTGVNLTIYQWNPPSTVTFPNAKTNAYTGGECLATAHGTRDVNTFSGKWHMQFKITFTINNVESGFNFRHDCTAVGLVHAATWDGQGFGVFEGVKVAGISIADLTRPPVTKIMWGEVTGGFDNMPTSNLP